MVLVCFPTASPGSPIVHLRDIAAAFAMLPPMPSSGHGAYLSPGWNFPGSESGREDVFTLSGYGCLFCSLNHIAASMYFDADGFLGSYKRIGVALISGAGGVG